MFRGKNSYFTHRAENKYLEDILTKEGLWKTESKGDRLRHAKEISSWLWDRVYVGPNFKFYDINKRPFLRHTAKYTLEKNEGLCGEGARVLVRIFNLLGYDATRISLWTRTLESHSLIAIDVDGMDYFIDSINSTHEFHDFVLKNDVPINTVQFQLPGQYGTFKGTTAQGPLKIFVAYSYTVTPVGKILDLFGVKSRTMMFSRPYRWLSVVLESPHLTMALFWVSVAIVYLVFIVLIYRIILKRTS